MDRVRLVARLEGDEGKKYRMYLDNANPPRWTAGVGRNLSDRPFSDDEIALMLRNDIAAVEQDLDHTMPWWRTMTDARQNALANACFNLGINRLLGFKNALSMLQAGRWDAAADAFLDSAWAKQVPNRARRITDLIRKGQFDA